MTTQAELAADWRGLAKLDDADQIAAIRERLTQLAGHPESRFATEVEKLLLAEIDLEDREMERLTRSRLRAWLQIPPEVAGRFAIAIEGARETLAGPSAMRSTMAVQSAVRNLEREEVVQLLEVAPPIRRAISEEFLEVLTSEFHLGEAEPSADAAQPERIRIHKPWWRFW